ncbi:MAG: UDP-3-O-(3-hydroxymyristoyl)glucosamine N-acyltransferase [Rhodocyclaceae bacterium]|nr:UDP-3-O-(3-hydroxymyristoyl)glucosamine N-acyltransferase [Rhodocyclaceae bacterium]
MATAIPLGVLATHLDAVVEGDSAVCIDGVGTLEAAGAGQLSFLANPRYRRQLAACRAAAVLMRPDTECPADFAGARLRVADPYLAFARASRLLHPLPPLESGIHPSAIVDASAIIDRLAQVGPHAVVGAGARIGPGVAIGAGCVVGGGVSIGAGTRLHPRVVVYDGCVIGAHCILHSGAVIGADGFGLAWTGERWEHIPQTGRVVIGDHVDVGANTTIDRGALEDTVIADGVKLDNQIQIGHNCVLGEHTAVAGCVGIAGSTRIGPRCRIGGAAMISGHLEIAGGSEIAGGTAITRSIGEAGVYASVFPFMPFAQWRRNAAQLRHLDDLSRRLRALEQGVGAAGVADVSPSEPSESA